MKSGRTLWTGHVARRGDTRNAYGIFLCGKLLGNFHLDHQWEDNIKMDLREIGCQDERSMEVTQDRERWWALILVGYATIVTKLRVNSLHKKSSEDFLFVCPKPRDGGACCWENW
jgi:hypothetical protein